jgi:hypothetical protein
MEDGGRAQYLRGKRPMTQFSTSRPAGIAIALCLAAGLAAPARAQQINRDTLPYRNARLPIPDRVRDLVGRMTLEEKFW